MKKIVLPNLTLNDDEFDEFCEDNDYSEEEVIKKMINEGWSLGLDLHCSWQRNIFWPPE